MELRVGRGRRKQLKGLFNAQEDKPETGIFTHPCIHPSFSIILPPSFFPSPLSFSISLLTPFLSPPPLAPVLPSSIQQFVHHAHPHQCTHVSLTGINLMSALSTPLHSKKRVEALLPLTWKAEQTMTGLGKNYKWQSIAGKSPGGHSPWKAPGMRLLLLSPDTLDRKTMGCLRKLPCIPDQALATGPLINLLLLKCIY